MVEGSPDALKNELRGDTIRSSSNDTSVNGRVPAALARVVGVRDRCQRTLTQRTRGRRRHGRTPVLAALEADAFEGRPSRSRAHA